MATQHDEGGSRLWRGMRALIFGDDGETSLRDQIEEAIDEAETSHTVSGDLSPLERQMLRNLLQFGDRTAGDICVTRGDIISIPVTTTFEQLIHAFAEAGHSRLPVYGESLDDIVGIDEQGRERTDKAGALDAGLKNAKGELVAIFDADFVPPRDILHNVLDYFTDDMIGLLALFAPALAEGVSSTGV